MNAEPIPDVLGPFRPRALLGSGGTGLVFRAEWGHREVALKVLRDDIAISSRERERFLDEAGRLSSMSHPGIVKILSFGQLPDSRPYLAMELLEGETLAQRLERGPLPPQLALRLIADVASAVAAMHARGLIHRDLKPENLYIVGGDQVILLDFGIAKELDAQDSTITQEGGVRGTPAYMAPERFFGEPAGVATDVYEMAVVLYAMLTARLPWKDGSEPLARLDPLPLSAHGITGLDGLEVVLRGALSTRSEKRPESAAVFAQAVGESSDSGVPRQTRDLRGLAAEATPAPQTTTAPPSEAEPVQEKPHRNPRRFWAAAAALALCGAGVATAVSLGGADAQAAAGDASVAPTASPDAAVAVATAPDPAPVISRVTIPTRSGDDSGLARVLSHLPADELMVLGFRARQVRQNPLLARFFDRMKTSPRYAPLGAVAESCGIDLMDDVDWGVVASPDRDEFDLVVAGDWSRERAEECLGKWALVKGEDVQRDGAITRFGKSSAGALALAWLDERTVLLTSRAKIKDGWLRERLAGSRRSLDKGPLARVAAAIDTSSSLWIIGRGTELLEKSNPELLPKKSGLEAWALEATLDQALSSHAALQMKNPAKARELEVELRQKLQELESEPMAKLMIDELKLETKGRDIEFRLSLGPMMTGVVIKALESAAKDMGK
jgi:predicted Ser/Thr protein kinase